MKPYKDPAPSFSLVIRHPWLIISTFFGAGCLTPAPGTWGSFAAWAVFALMEFFIGRSFVWSAVAVGFIIGCFSVSKSAPYLGKTDHGSIVIDEVVAVWLTLLLTPVGLFWQLFSVLAFRFFDIVKLPPVSVLDGMKQNGFTVMLDDIFAAAYAVFLINLIAFVFQLCFVTQPVWIFI